MPFHKTFQKFILLTLLFSNQLSAQSAEPCVDFAWNEFRNEIENELNAVEAQGDDYLTAYGLIRSTQMCLQFTDYPVELVEAATTFREAVDRTEDTIADAILTNTTAPIFGLAMTQPGSEGGGIIYFYPDVTPGNEASDTSGSDGNTAVFTGTLMTMELARPLLDTATPTYRMLSQAEVRRVQAWLMRLGYDTGGADGIAGERTFNAIRLYQRAEGQRTTGVLTSAQLERILN